MSAAMNATKTRPSRNIVAPIRAMRPRSVAYRVRAMCGASVSSTGCITGSPVIPLHPTGGTGTRSPPPGGRLDCTGLPLATADWRQAFPPGSARDQTVVRQQLADIVHGGVLGRQDEVRWLQRVSRQR